MRISDWSSDVCSSDLRVRSRVDEKIDVVLPKQRDVLAPVSGHRREPHHLEQAMQLRDAVRARRGELDELEAVGRQRVVLDVMVHCKVLLNFPRVRESDEFARQAASCPTRGGTASSPAYARSEE